MHTNISVSAQSTHWVLWYDRRCNMIIPYSRPASNKDAKWREREKVSVYTKKGKKYTYFIVLWQEIMPYHLLNKALPFHCSLSTLGIKTPFIHITYVLLFSLTKPYCLWGNGWLLPPLKISCLCEQSAYHTVTSAGFTITIQFWVE